MCIQCTGRSEVCVLGGGGGGWEYVFLLLMYLLFLVFFLGVDGLG